MKRQYPVAVVGEEFWKGWHWTTVMSGAAFWNWIASFSALNLNLKALFEHALRTLLRDLCESQF